MKNEKINAARVWKQMGDLVVPGLRLSVYDRAVYSHLLRHSRLEGRTQFCFSIPWLARGACLTLRAARRSVHSLVGKGALRLAERGQVGHVVKVLLPEEIRALHAGRFAARAAAMRMPSAGNIEKADFMGTRTLRLAIHAREGGRCFYCLGRMSAAVRCLDHVVPRVRRGAMATAIWCPRVRNAICGRGSSGRRIICGGCAARGD